MSAVAAAVVGGAVIGAVASKKGAEAQAGAAESGQRMTQAQFEQTREDQAPWRLAGERALEAIQAAPDFQFTPTDFEAFKDPAYEFRMEEGLNVLERGAAAKGRVLSGAQGKALTRYGQDLASQEYGNAFNRALVTYQQKLATQQSLAGVGQTAVAQTQQAGQFATRQQNILAAQGAQATAQGYSGMAQSMNQGIGNYLLYQQTRPPATPAAAVAPDFRIA